MATYLKESSGEGLAAAIYAGSFFLMGAVFVGANRHILLDRTELLKEPLAEPEARRILHFAALGQIPYLVATLLAFITPYITLVICAGCAVYYSLPIASRGAGRQSGANIA
jgi:hypothetical protein